MLTMPSTLLIGNYDWDAENMPKAEFQDRVKTLFSKLPQHCAGVAVYGDRRDNAELVYFGHLVPKLRDGMALIPRSGEPKMLLAGGGESVVPGARQHWMGKTESMTELGKVLAQWKAELKGDIAVIGTDRVRLSLEQGAAESASAECSKRAAEAVRSMMRVKSARELAEIRRGCAMLKSAAGALREAVKSGKGVTDAMAIAEHEAVKQRAMEVRSLFSLDGGRTLRPFIRRVERKVDPLQAYIAVRSGGYWVDAFLRTDDKAADALKKLVAAMKPGATAKDLARVASADHPLLKGELGNAVGVSLDEEPRLSAASDARLEAGAVYSVRAAAGDAIASAIVAVTERGSEVLYTS
jgi:Xaa-Pro aminopeptidase